ncbi:MAG: outer membrane beta-barrel protein [Rhodobacteraceae bacterium]|nr:outer membrane beta-barrel protein [Paracoccaceae bacterium]
MRRLVLAAAMAAMAAAGAGAQTSFDGPYLGFAAGFGRGTVAGLAPRGPDPAGVRGALFAGFSATRGTLLWGVEIGAGLGPLAARTACTNPVWTCTASLGGEGSLRARLGVVRGPVLLYATLGLAAGSATLATRDGAGRRHADTRVLTGWVAGLGIEGGAGDGRRRWRLEYLHHDLGRATFATDVAYPAALAYGEVRVGVVAGF